MDYDALARMYDSAGALQAKQIGNQYKLGKEEIKARLKIASQSSKDTRFGIEQERDAARERVEQARAEMERIGIPDMEIRRFVAESTAEIARQELGLKREIFLAESGLARDQLAKDIREMEEIGIPRVEIERYAAEKAAELGQLEYGLKRDAFVEQQRQYGIDFAEARRQFDTAHAEEARQFNVGASGYMQTGGQLAQPEQARMNQIQARDDELRAAGGPGVGGNDLLELQRYQQTLATGGGEQRTLQGQELDRQYALDVQRFGADEAERRRRYGLDVAKLGTELSQTPDQYFAARRFQGMDVPRLLGGAGAPTLSVYGGPTPQIATMQARLSGQDPASVGAPMAGSGPGSVGLPGTPEDDRQKQLAAIAKASPPSPYDGLDDSDSATLRLMESIYKKGFNQIPGGELERLQASGRMGFLTSAGKLLGYSPEQEIANYQAYRPTQGQANLA
jgi:hypothetical protein